MGNMIYDDNDKDKKGGPNKIAMYLSLAMCLIALAAGAWSAVNRFNSASQGVEPTHMTTENVEGAEQKVTNITQELTTAQPTTKKKVEPTKVNQRTVSAVAEFFTFPVGGTITKKFNDKELQYSDTYDDWRIHLGIDIVADKGTEVHSAGNGKVVKVYEDQLMGNTVIIDHGNGIEGYYCGLNSPLVKANQVVEAGATIGGIGDIPSEIVEQAHLHFAVKKDNKWVEPIKTLQIEII